MFALDSIEWSSIPSVICPYARLLASHCLSRLSCIWVPVIRLGRSPASEWRPGRGRGVTLKSLHVVETRIISCRIPTRGPDHLTNWKLSKVILSRWTSTTVDRHVIPTFSGRILSSDCSILLVGPKSVTVIALSLTDCFYFKTSFYHSKLFSVMTKHFVWQMGTPHKIKI